MCPAVCCSTCSFFVTAYGDVLSASRALKAGAVEFLMKPVQKHELPKAIEQALKHDRAQRVARAEFSA